MSIKGKSDLLRSRTALLNSLAGRAKERDRSKDESAASAKGKPSGRKADA